ncbi:MAG: heme ABC exporter ATP-binding protein CcmA [Chloroflexi bacterium]|nr:heme ABC exporter ATP-binding protein CcmA [Chloroflexota bacterium]
MTAPATLAVQARSLEKSFGEWPVLWDLDLSVPWGQTLVLFGANGAGKTTLLRILATHVRPDHGSVAVAGHNLRTRPEEIRRRIGVVGHRSLLYDDLTCRENLVYYGRLYGLKDHKKRVDEVLEKVRLTSRADHRVRTLSNGMQKRASIARAILHQPDVLLLDEPEAGLDRDSVSILGALLAEWTDSGRSVIMTTHDLDLGLSWGHRVGVLRGGKVDFPDAKFPQDGDGIGSSEIRQAVADALVAGR